MLALYSKKKVGYIYLYCFVTLSHSGSVFQVLHTIKAMTTQILAHYNWNIFLLPKNLKSRRLLFNRKYLNHFLLNFFPRYKHSNIHMKRNIRFSSRISTKAAEIKIFVVWLTDVLSKLHSGCSTVWNLYKKYLLSILTSKREICVFPYRFYSQTKRRTFWTI